jgi:hypothetical protein
MGRCTENTKVMKLTQTGLIVITPVLPPTSYSALPHTSINFPDHWILRYLRKSSELYVWLLYSSCCSHLEHRTSVKRFVSLHFLNLRHSVRLLGRVISPSQGRSATYHEHRINTNRHLCLEWDSNPRSQRSRERRHFMP